MKYSYTDEKLTLEADESDRANLRELKRDCDAGGFPFGTTQHESEIIEGWLGNSDLQWCSPVDTGDLTDAPLLGIWGDDTTDPENYVDSVFSAPYFGFIHSSTANGVKHYTPIVRRWGYEPYAARSFLTDLMETGKAVFLASW